MGLFNKLSHKSLFTLCHLIDLPFASHLDFPTIPWVVNGALAVIWEMQKDTGVGVPLWGRPFDSPSVTPFDTEGVLLQFPVCHRFW